MVSVSELMQVIVALDASSILVGESVCRRLQWLGHSGEMKARGRSSICSRSKADVVARFQGGPNAGHTVVVQGQQYVLHSLPTGVLHPGKKAVIGNGTVIDPDCPVRRNRGLAPPGRRGEGSAFDQPQSPSDSALSQRHRSRRVRRFAAIGASARRAVASDPPIPTKRHAWGFVLPTSSMKRLLHDRLQANLG